jgi:hypothetical protein
LSFSGEVSEIQEFPGKESSWNAGPPARRPAAITLEVWKTVCLTPARGLPDLHFALLRPR